MTSQNGRATWDTGEPVITPARKAAAPARQGIRPGWVIALGALASLVLGVVLVAAGTASSQSSGSSTPGTVRAFGVILIVASLLAGIGGIIALVSKEIARERAWKATLSPQDRRIVEVAETAALWAAWGVVHHNVKESRARHLAEFNARGDAWKAGQAQRQQDQIAADLHTLASQGSHPSAPAFTGTRRSDIYGNLV